MKTATSIAYVILHITGLVQITTGLLFWTGNAYSLIPVHMLSGLILVLSLWTIAIVALLMGVNRGLAAVALGWGLIVPILGVTQSGLLPGPYHWVIQLIHLLVGVVAMGMGVRLGGRIRELPSPAPA